MEIKNKSWMDFYMNESNKEYFKKIITKYNESKKENIVYPSEENIFRSFELTDLDNLKVVILGQDPYYSKCKKTNNPFANGLAFSVNKECSIPKSLKNIFNKIGNKEHGDLSEWAKQGVFLLNTQLTVIEGKPNSHKFWNKFTDRVIEYISEKKQNIIFVLWGNNSLKKKKLINEKEHTIFITSHPSPLSYKRKLKTYPSFYDFDIFNKINDKLTIFNIKNIKF